MVFVLVYAMVMAIAYFGVLKFLSWPQVEDLHYSRLDLVLLRDHPHFWRYLIARPGLQLSDRIGDLGFSLYVSNFAVGSLFLMYYLLRGRPLLIIVGAVFSIFVVQFFMNGRGAISWFGWMAILAIMFHPKLVSLPVRIPVLLFALLCCSVSSGTFSVAYISVLAYTASRMRHGEIWKNVFVISLILIAYNDLFLEGLVRNLSYYTLGTRNPVVNMLRHGAGAIILNYPVLFVLVIPIFMAIGLWAFLFLRRKPEPREIIALVVPVAGGVFGYTTLTLLLPSLITVLARRAGGLPASRSRHR